MIDINLTIGKKYLGRDEPDQGHIKVEATVIFDCSKSAMEFMLDLQKLIMKHGDRK